MSNAPGGEYARRREARRGEADRLRRRDGPVGSAGLWAISILLLLALPALLSWIPAWVLLIPFGAAVACWVVHARFDARLKPLDAAARFYEEGLARIEDRWIGTGRTGTEYDDPKHPYAADLDVFGKGSLFELLCTVRTRTGEKTLARWLLEPAPPEEIRARQGAVGELRDRIDLREDLFVLTGELQTRVKPEELAEWGAGRSGLPGAGVRWAAVGLTVLNVAALGVWPFVGILPFIGALFVSMTFMRMVRPRVWPILELAEKAERELEVLAAVLARMERETFASPRLSGLQATLREGGAPASVRIARLARLVQQLQSMRNELFRILGGVLLWRVHYGFAIERWRAQNGREIARWLAAVGEMEALGALAGYAYERPEDPFPEIADAGPVYEGEGLGHPLLPEESCVRNDVRLGAAPRVLLVSGSNMSGKSTLLRTVGANAVLAQTGAPVRAKRLRLSPLSIGATIRVQDSLQAGTSRFYAEITRLRQVMDLGLENRPLLFLLEEILHGTNSHDRAIGAELVIRSLVDRNAIGLVTTHDLALTTAAEKMGEKAANVHFEDQIEDGRLAFDYTLRPGVVTKSNALQLMRSVGLPV